MTVLAAALSTPAAAQGVTYERILNADNEPQNWITHAQNYSNQRYSRLDQINKDTVGDLQFAFSVALEPMKTKPSGDDGEFESTPLVDNGFMFLTDGWAKVYKIDVTGGERGTVQWKMDPGTDPEYPWGSLHNRGVALLGDKVYSVALDGRLIATNIDTGEVIWEKNFQSAPGEYFTVAPLVVKDKIIWGAAGGETGSRDWLMGNDAETGEMVWKTYTIPGPGEPGHETWADDHNAYLVGGGSIWVTGAYDPEQNITIWGIGNPSPDGDPDFRPGDNLYTNSALALNADNGEIAWHFQYTPNDSWDYDEVGSHVLVDTEINGEPRKAVLHGARNGFFYALDRQNGAFINGVQYVDKLTWTAGLDPKTGLPVEYDASKQVQTYIPAARQRREVTVETCPRLNGGTNWFPTAYSPRTNRLYGSSIEGCHEFTGTNMDVKVAEGLQPGGDGWGGMSSKRLGTTTGSVYAIDVATGTVAAKRATTFANISGVLATAGGLVFNAEIDGDFVALDDETLEVLWKRNLGALNEAPAMSYAVDGKQYIAVLSGGRPGRKGYFADGPQPELGANIEMGNTLFVFTLM
jgi:alcohol dehydrogenase (cytochrome c)